MKPLLLTFIAGFLFLATPVQAAKSILNPSADTFINSITTNANTNYGANQTLRFSKNGKEINDVLIRYDLSSIPQGSKITKATFRLHQESYKGDNTILSLGVNIYPVVTNWQEKTATWNNRPSVNEKISQPNGQPYMAASNSDFQEWDVLPIVQDWVDKVVTNNGLLIEPYSNGWYSIFTSREGNPNQADFLPQLSVIYTDVPTPTPVGLLEKINPSKWLGSLTGITPSPTLEPTAAVSITETPVPTQEIKAVGSATTTPVPAITAGVDQSAGNSLTALLTANNLKLAAIAVFVLAALKIIFRK